MAFIRHKKVNGATYYSVVESVRVSGKVQQKTIVSLGRSATIREAITEAEWWANQYRENADRYPRRSGKLAFGTPEGRLFFLAVGKNAEAKAEELTARIELLKQWQGKL